MSYQEVEEFLDRHTDVIELTDGHGARVAVCPPSDVGPIERE